MLCAPPEIAATAPLILCIHGAGCTGNYFDLSSNSLAEAAASRGMPTLLADRPGHGTSREALTGSAIDRSVDAAIALVNDVRAAHPSLDRQRVGLIGHSLGGVVALLVACRMAAAGDAPIAICMSGIGDRHSEEYRSSLVQTTGATAQPTPYWLFGPGSSYDWRGITALRGAAAPWRAAELDELHRSWPDRWAETAKAVTAPVHFRLAEFERIWEATPAAIERIAKAFSHALSVDAAIAPDGGHLYEAHLRGPELVASQLDFIARAAGHDVAGRQA